MTSLFLIGLSGVGKFSGATFVVNVLMLLAKDFGIALHVYLSIYQLKLVSS